MDNTIKQGHVATSKFLEDLNELVSEEPSEFGDMTDDFGAFDWPDNFNDMTKPEY